MILKILPFRTSAVGATATQVAALRGKALPVSFVEDVQVLAQDMVDTVKYLHAKGLAANQVGELKRLVVVVLDGEPTVMINPEIIKYEGVQHVLEGCLSFVNVSAIIDRPSLITVRYTDSRGDELVELLSNYDAAAVCHELDHLDGILLVDRLFGLTKRNFLRRVNKKHRKMNRDKQLRV